MEQQGNNTQQGDNTQGMGMPYSVNPYQPDPMTGLAPAAPGGSIQSAQPNMLQAFWARQRQEIERTTDFKSHKLPLARIKKIMKADEDVRMISAETPVIFAKACEMFIQELTLRAWNHTEENKRRTLQRSDVAAAVARTEIFDFLVDIVPGEDPKDEALAPMPGAGGGLLPPVGQPSEGLPYHYMPPLPPPQIGGPPGMFVGKPVDPTAHGQQAPPPVMPPPPQVWPQQPSPPPPPTGGA